MEFNRNCGELPSTLKFCHEVAHVGKQGFENFCLLILLDRRKNLCLQFLPAWRLSRARSQLGGRRAWWLTRARSQLGGRRAWRLTRARSQLEGRCTSWLAHANKRLVGRRVSWLAHAIKRLEGRRAWPSAHTVLVLRLVHHHVVISHSSGLLVESESAVSELLIFRLVPPTGLLLLFSPL